LSVVWIFGIEYFEQAVAAGTPAPVELDDIPD
jgi:hypothetical protein